MRKTKIRIVGNPTLASKILFVIEDNFEIEQIRRFNKAPTRYSRSDSPGATIYVDVKREKEAKP